jgi:toxin HigB-1
MLSTFREKWLKDFFVDDIHSKKIPAQIKDRLFRKLQLIDDATCDLDLRVPKSNHFEKLIGKLKCKVAIRVNDQWRLIFEWDSSSGEASGVYLNNHSYR